MKIFRKKVRQHEKVLAEARELAAQRLERYLADRRNPPPEPLRHAVGEELVSRGLQPKPDTGNSFHVKDPNGFDLQICGKDMTGVHIVS